MFNGRINKLNFIEQTKLNLNIASKKLIVNLKRKFLFIKKEQEEGPRKWK